MNSVFVAYLKYGNLTITMEFSFHEGGFFFRKIFISFLYNYFFNKFPQTSFKKKIIIENYNQSLNINYIDYLKNPIKLL